MNLNCFWIKNYVFTRIWTRVSQFELQDHNHYTIKKYVWIAFVQIVLLLFSKLFQKSDGVWPGQNNYKILNSVVDRNLDSQVTGHNRFKSFGRHQVFLETILIESLENSGKILRLEKTPMTRRRATETGEYITKKFPKKY